MPKQNPVRRADRAVNRGALVVTTYGAVLGKNWHIKQKHARDNTRTTAPPIYAIRKGNGVALWAYMFDLYRTRECWPRRESYHRLGRLKKCPEEQREKCTEVPRCYHPSTPRVCNLTLRTSQNIPPCSNKQNIRRTVVPSILSQRLMKQYRYHRYRVCHPTVYEV